MNHASEFAEQEAELRAEVEAMFRPHPQVGNHAHAATGEEYVEIVSGWKHLARCGSLEDAIMIWRWRLGHYINGLPSNAYHISSPTVLYWRCTPEIGREKVQDGVLTKDVWGIYSRLLISNAPELCLQVVQDPQNPRLQIEGDRKPA